MGLFKSWMKKPKPEEEFEMDFEYIDVGEMCDIDCDDCAFADACDGYEFTKVGRPENIASAALILSGLADSIDDPRVNKFYELYRDGMIRHGYIQGD